MINIAIITMFYTSFGHRKISSYLSDEASKHLGRQVDIKIEEMSLSPSHLDATIMIDEEIKTTLEGFYAPFSGKYDIQYQLVGVNKDTIDINGTVLGTKDDFKLSGKGDVFEGKASFSGHYQEKVQRDIKVVLEQVDTAKVLKLLGEKPLFAGRVSLLAEVPLFSEFEKEGDIMIEIARGGVYLHNIKSLFGIQLPDDFMLQANGRVRLGSGKDTFWGDVNSTLADIQLKEGTFLEANEKISAKYHLGIKELSQLAFVTKKKYVGAFEAKGSLEYRKGIRFDGESDSLDGKLHYYFEKGQLEGFLKEVSLEKLLTMMAYPPIMIGTFNGKASYNTEDKIALINIESQNAHFQNSSLVQKIYQASGVDFSKERFSNTYFASSVENGLVSYDFKAENKSAYLSLLNTKMDASKNTITSDFNLKMQEEELSGQIYGSLKSPKVKINMGKFLKFKAKKEIDSFFGMGASDRLKKMNVEDIKGFLKGFF